MRIILAVLMSFSYRIILPGALRKTEGFVASCGTRLAIASLTSDFIFCSLLGFNHLTEDSFTGFTQVIAIVLNPSVILRSQIALSFERGLLLSQALLYPYMQETLTEQATLRLR